MDVEGLADRLCRVSRIHGDRLPSEPGKRGRAAWYRVVHFHRALTLDPTRALKMVDEQQTLPWVIFDKTAASPESSLAGILWYLNCDPAALRGEVGFITM